MGLLFSPHRPIARWAAHGARERDPAAGRWLSSARSDARAGGVVVDLAARRNLRAATPYLPADSPDELPCPGVLVRALDALAAADVSVARDVFTEDVVGWWPNHSVSSRAELEAALADMDHALTDISITARAFCGVGNLVAAEWQLTAQHDRAVLVDDDVLLEPTNHRVVLAGATFAEIESDRIQFFHHYFDDSAILEQLLLDTS